MTQKIQKNIAWIISIAFITVYFYKIIVKAYNFPFYDDYDAIIKFNLNWIKANGLIEKLKVLFAQHNEHRILFLRLISLIQLAIIGVLNFKILIYIGNLSLIVITIVLFKKCISNNNIWLLPTIICILFQFSNWDNTFWAMTSLQNFWIDAWVILFFYFFFSNLSSRLILSAISLFFVFFTSGNGFLISPILLFFLILNKNKRDSLLFSSLLLLFIFIYFFQFTFNKSGLLQKFDLLAILKYFFAFIGSLLYYPKIAFLSILSGIIVCALYVYSFLKKYYLKNPFLFAVLTFMLFTAGVVALGRFDKGFETAFISRYRINSTIILIISYLVINDLFQLNRLKYVNFIVFVFSFVFNIMMYFTYQDRIEQTRDNRLTDAWFWENKNCIYSYIDQERAGNLLKEAKKMQIMRFDFKDYSELWGEKSILQNKGQNEPNMDVKIDYVRKNTNNEIEILGSAFVKDKPLFLKKIYLVSDSKNESFGTKQVRRYDLMKKYDIFDFQDSGFFLKIRENDLADINKIMICSKNNCFTYPLHLVNK